MKLEKIKRCVRCYKIISFEDEADYYSHISIKYCDDCRKIVLREQAKARMANMRKRTKAEVKELQERVRVLETENDALRSRLNSAWDGSHAG